MTCTTETLRPAGRLARTVRSRLDREGDEGGFILLEVMISLTLITAIMAAVSVEYVNGMVLSASQRTVASASQVASSALSDLRTVNPSDLLRGRTESDARAQRQRLLLVKKVADRINATDDFLAFDNSAASRVIDTSARTVQIGTRSFKVDTYLECQRPAAVTTVGNSPNQHTVRDCHDVLTADGSDVPNNMRATVAVVWTGSRCPSTGCAFVTSTLVDTHANPTFDVSQPLPATPLVASPGNQTVAKAEKVSLQLLVQDGRGAAPFTWALTSGSLPAGLQLSPSGLISGTVASTAVNTSSTITVTDAFLRQATVTFSWSVIAELVFTNPGPQAHTPGQSVALTLRASGGAGAPYTFSDPTSSLPPGLTLNGSTGQITGAPTKSGQYDVTLAVKDASNKRTTMADFTWKVDYPPFAVNSPGDQVGTVGRPESVQVVAGGGSGTYTYAVSSGSLPNGLALGSTTGLISGTPSATRSASNVTVRVTDTRQSGLDRTVTFSYRIVAVPTIATPSNQASTKGGTATLDTSATCANTPCTYTAANLPNGLTINASTGRISGTLASNATTSTNVRITVTDHAQAAATTDPFTWTINEPAVATTFYGLTSPYRLKFSFESSSFFTGGSGPYRYTATGLPNGASIDAATGTVSGTLGSTSSKSAVSIKQVDASGVEVAWTWTWWVSDLAFTVPDQTLQRQATSIELGGRTSGGTGPYTYYLVSGPPGLRINGSNIEGTPTEAGTFNPTVRVVDSTGAFVDAKPKMVVQ